MKKAKLFMNGRSQAVRLPKEFRFEGSEVLIKRMGNGVLLIPQHESWQTMKDSLEMFTEDFLETRAQPQQQEREDLFE